MFNSKYIKELEERVETLQHQVSCLQNIADSLVLYAKELKTVGDRIKLEVSLSVKIGGLSEHSIPICIAYKTKFDDKLSWYVEYVGKKDFKQVLPENLSTSEVTREVAYQLNLSPVPIEIILNESSVTGAA